MLPIQSFHPEVLISNHFDNIKYQIDINTESILEKLEKLTVSSEEIKIFNDVREKQIEKNSEIELYNLNLVKFDENEYKLRWQHVIDDGSLDYDKKIDLIKETLIFKDCILMGDSELKSRKSLWIMPAFYNLKDVDFLR